MNKSGFFLVDKPVGRTSFSVCAQIRKQFGVKKVGHTGTLDPFATGLLVVAMGKCTKLIPFLEKAHKSYTTTIALGQTSETLDTEAKIIFDGVGKQQLLQKTNQGSSLEAQIKKILLERFTGSIKQIPPKYSALKIGGKKMCDLARAGETFEIQERSAEVFSVELTAVNFLEDVLTIDIDLTVAAGFYVRCFARDLARELGTTGMCLTLRRTAIDYLSIDDAETPEMITQPIDPQFILSAMPRREIPLGRVQDFMAGRAFPFSGVNGEKFLVIARGHTCGIGEMISGMLQPRAVM